MRNIINIDYSNMEACGAFNSAVEGNELLLSIRPLISQFLNYRLEIIGISGKTFISEELISDAGILTYLVPIEYWNAEGFMKVRLLSNEGETTFCKFTCITIVTADNICCKYYNNAFVFYRCSIANPTIDLIYPVGHIITNGNVTFDPNKQFPGTNWKKIKGRVISGIDENDTDTNKKTSFNQASGTLIGNKWLHAHGHSWVGVNDGANTGYSPGVYPFRIYQDVGVNWTGTFDFIRTAGAGDAQNIQPTYLAYIWIRVS